MKRIVTAIVSAGLVAVACVFTTDPETERTDLQEVCAIDGKWLSQIGPGNHALPGPASFALLHDPHQGHWILDAADCRLREVKLPAPRTREIIAPMELTTDAILYAALGNPAERYGLIEFSTGHEIGGALPQTEEGKSPGAHFSFDGKVAAWMEDGSENSRDRVHIAEIGRLESGIVFSPGEQLGVDEYRLIDVVAGGEAGSANTRGGGGVESVTVWFRDGTTRYHRQRRSATRASLVFLGDDRFAYPEIDEKGQATTRVFRLPN